MTTLSIYDSTLSAFMRPPSSDVVIIAIDDASLASLGRWPWSRRTHAALVDRAREAGARAMMMDLILDTPSRDDPEADQQSHDGVAERHHAPDPSAPPVGAP